MFTSASFRFARCSPREREEERKEKERKLGGWITGEGIKLLFKRSRRLFLENHYLPLFLFDANGANPAIFDLFFVFPFPGIHIYFCLRGNYMNDSQFSGCNDIVYIHNGLNNTPSEGARYETGGTKIQRDTKPTPVWLTAVLYYRARIGGQACTMPEHSHKNGLNPFSANDSIIRIPPSFFPLIVLSIFIKKLFREAGFQLPRGQRILIFPWDNVWTLALKAWWQDPIHLLKSLQKPAKRPQISRLIGSFLAENHSRQHLGPFAAPLAGKIIRLERIAQLQFAESTAAACM